VEVPIFAENGEAVIACEPLNDFIRLVGQAEGLDMGGAGEGGANLCGNAIREVFVQQEFHPWTAMS
jgi:hypothetical protein